jgi:hypothetical protein
MYRVPPFLSSSQLRLSPFPPYLACLALSHVEETTLPRLPKHWVLPLWQNLQVWYVLTNKGK